MPEHTLSDSQLIFIVLGSIAGIIIAPLVGALLLWLTTKLFRFGRTSYPLSIACVFIAVACSTAVISLLSMLLFEHLTDDSGLFGIAAIVVGVVAEVVAVKFLFKERWWKSVGATVVSMGVGFVLYILTILAVVALFGEQLKAIFPVNA